MEKILIIEDDNILRENIAEILEANDYDVFSANNGIEGVKLVEEIMPDLILCDIMMPGIDGYNVKEYLSKKEELGIIPFIFLTAKTKVEDIQQGLSLGADDYILKPFETEDLLNIIEMRLEKYEKIKETGRKSFSAKNEESGLTDRILIDSNKNKKMLLLKDIVLITADGNYTSVLDKNQNKLFKSEVMTAK